MNSRDETKYVSYEKRGEADFPKHEAMKIPMQQVNTDVSFSDQSFHGWDQDPKEQTFR